jgi:hypothetical protein
MEENKYVADSVEEFSDFNLTESVKQKNLPQATVDNPVVNIETQEEFDKLLEDDFNTARENIKKVIERGDDVLASMISLAEASDHPRAYEVVATIMKTLLDANNDLLTLHEKKNKSREKPAKTAGELPGATNNTQNNIYVGSTAELQRLLENDDD